MTNDYAHIGRRFCAFLLDSILFWILGLALFSFALIYPLLGLLGLFLCIAYEVIFIVSPWQGTPGKKMMGIYVTTLDGYDVGIGRAALRTFIKIWFVPGVVFIGMLAYHKLNPSFSMLDTKGPKLATYVMLSICWGMALLNSQKRALHDLVAGTVVVCN